MPFHFYSQNIYCRISRLGIGHVIGKLCLFLVMATAVLAMVSTPAEAKKKDNPLYASIVIDADTGKVLRARNADKSLHPASLTKIMTLLMVFEALERGDITLRSRVPISKNAEAVVPSKLGLKAGSSIRVEDAIYALVTKSANDIAVALGEYLGGSEARFARMMTARAKDLGMQHTAFRNASGLHDPNQVSSARDMSVLARYILRRHPYYYRYFSTKQFTYRGQTYNNHNRLMNSYEGMDGFKTGYINASGFNLVASAVRGNRRLIGVVFGGRSAQTRNTHMASILDEGFSKYGDIRTAKAAPPQPQQQKNAPPPRLAASSDPAPIPPRKPGTDSYTSLAALESGTRINTGQFGKVIGQGDYDPDVSQRLETGLMAVSAHKAQYVHEQEVADIRGPGQGSAAHVAPAPVSVPSARAVYYQTPASADRHTDPGWAVQLGAYTDRVATDDALYRALNKLPRELRGASPVAVPLRTAHGMLFRARLSGFSKSEALTACRYFRECMIIAPKTN